MSKIEKLKRFLANIEKLDHDADKAIAHLSEVHDLGEEKRNAHHERDNARSERDGANSEREEAVRRLSSVRLEIDQAVKTRDGLDAENAKAASNLAAVQEKVKANSHLIEFAVAIQLLFSDISKIPLILLIELANWLEMIVGAKLNPAAIYPIDYNSIRDKAVDMLGLVLGKALVTRKAFDDVIMSIVEPHDDLLLDKLVKIERESTHLAGEKRDVAAKREALQRAALDKLLPAALDLQTKGFIVLHRCRTCSHTLAAFPAGVRYSITVCPFCGETTP